jgi:tricorn protease
MKKLCFLALLMVTVFAGLKAQDEMRLLRFPSVYGDKVVFSYAGDLYLVSTTGGIARRLTSDPGQELFAHFSPDGKYIAFTGQYHGNTEVYLMPAEGGLPKRLTFTATLNRDDISDRMGPNNIVMAWTPDSKNIIYRSRGRSFNDFVGQLYSVSVDGGMSEQLPLSSGGFCSYSPDGTKLAFNRVFREFRTWKYYRGGMADDIRIFDFKTKEISKITDLPSQEIIPMWFGNDIYYLSDQDRTMNLFVCDLTTKVSKKVTAFTDYDIKFPSMGKDGRIVFEQAGYIHIFDPATGKTTKLTIRIADDLEPGKSARIDASRFITGTSVSPDGKRIVVSARGDVFTVPAENGITRNITSTSGVHERSAVWSPDGNYIAYLSDETGEYQIYIKEQDGSAPAKKITSTNDNYIYSLLWSPDSKKILFNDREQTLQYVDIESNKVTLVAKSKVWEIHDYCWSPDSRWIAFTSPVKTGMNQILLYSIDNGQSYPVTQNWYSSSSPEFSSDGKFLAFISERDFNPIYSANEWNYAYRNMSRIYLLTLAAATENPLGERNDEVTITKEETPAEKSETPKAGKEKENGKGKVDQPADKGEKKEKVKPVIIDTEGLQDRIIDLPVRPANYWNLTMIGMKIYYNETYFGEKGSRLSMYNLESREETVLGDNMGYSITADQKKMMISAQGSYYVIPLPSSKVKTEKKADLSNMWVQPDLKQEWKQIYDESWRQMRDFFYDENMHGTNWKAIHDKYAVLLPYVSNRNDLNYLIGEMIGELSIGHAYVSGGDKYELKRVYTGYLGANLTRDPSSGYFRISGILKGQNWDDKLVSPLTQVGVDVKEGDYLIAINGKDLKNVKDPYVLLDGLADQPVEIMVNSKASTEGAKRFVVRPVKDESQLVYFNWVQNNIRKVNAATNDEVGYIHIPDMVTEGLNEFVKYYYPQLSKKALIIDGRGNGGGNVSPMIIERLRREIIRISAPRNVEEVGTTPGGMMTGPMVLIINQYSASDGDLFPYAFKKLGIGKVIGVRSWGGVIGIRGSLPFIDGGSLQKPEFGTYSSETGQWIIEGHGVDPDIIIDNDPYREFMGTDDQLIKAIEVVKEQLKTAYQIPSKPKGPDKSK